MQQQAHNYMTADQLSLRCGGTPSVGTLANWRSQVNRGLPNKGPAFVKIGKIIRYPLIEVEKWERTLLRGIG